MRSTYARRSRKPAVGQFYLFERFRRYEMSAEEWVYITGFAAERLNRHGLPLDAGIDAVTDAVLYAADHYVPGTSKFTTYASTKVKWALADLARDYPGREDALDHAACVGVGLEQFESWADRAWFADEAA